MPMVIHVGSPTFAPSDAEIFIREILPLARGIFIQIAHAGGGGYPVVKGRHQQILRIFADHIAKHDPATQNVWFDLSFVPAPDETQQDAMELRREIRRIGISRFVFGSDYNEDTPKHQIENLHKLGLTSEEVEVLRTNCTPWACPAQR
jgi:predicted TIM-barrel fold metal-dependent hydrolase